MVELLTERNRRAALRAADASRLWRGASVLAVPHGGSHILLLGIRSSRLRFTLALHYSWFVVRAHTHLQ